MKDIYHDNVAKVHHFIDDKLCYMMILDYYKNGSLADLIERREKITEPEVMYYGSKLIRLLIFLKNEHILHRDIKPANIMVSNEMQLILIDFELAKRVISEDANTYSFVGFP